MLQALSGVRLSVKPSIATQSAQAPRLGQLRFGQDEQPGDTLTVTKAALAVVSDVPTLPPLQIAQQLTHHLTTVADYLAERLPPRVATPDEARIGVADPLGLVVLDHSLAEVHMPRGITVSDMVAISRIQDDWEKLRATFPTLDAMSTEPKTSERIRLALRQQRRDELFEGQRQSVVDATGPLAYPPGMTPLSHAMVPLSRLYDQVTELIAREVDGELTTSLGSGGGGGNNGLSGLPIPGLVFPGVRRSRLTVTA